MNWGTPLPAVCGLDLKGKNFASGRLKNCGDPGKLTSTVP